MTCHDAEPMINALVDNELEAAGAIDIDRHLAECRACAAQYDALQSLREEIRAAHVAWTVPADLEQRLAARFGERVSLMESIWSSIWGRVGVVAAAAAVCAVLVALLLPAGGNSTREDVIATEILDSHLRALQPGHLIDVPSSDRHTVKPWFQGKTAFSPPVPDLTNDDFVLVGGRLEVIHQQAAAAVVYRRRQHVIDLYVAPSASGDLGVESREIGGYHLVHWVQDHTSYWVVSDIAATELRDFANLIRH